MCVRFDMLLIGIFFFHLCFSEATNLQEDYAPSYGTALEKKCIHLKSKTTAGYIQNRCYAASIQKYNVSTDQWQSLHSYCNHIEGYKSHLAHVRNEELIDKMLSLGVVNNDERYFIGSRHRPNVSVSVEIGMNHADDWYYYDENGKEMGVFNKTLWLVDEPDNHGDAPPEHVTALEKLLSNKLGVNDINPAVVPCKVLCEYVDFLTCPEGWILIERQCYKVFKNELTFKDAKAMCEKQRSARIKNTMLASIHEDYLNQHLALIARKVIPIPVKETGDKAHVPVMFGLRFNGSYWHYESNEMADYFRWYNKVGAGFPVQFFDGSSYVALLNVRSSFGSESRTGYWTIDKDTKTWPFICRGDPVF